MTSVELSCAPAARVPFAGLAERASCSVSVFLSCFGARAAMTQASRTLTAESQEPGRPEAMCQQDPLRGMGDREGASGKVGAVVVWDASDVGSSF